VYSQISLMISLPVKGLKMSWKRVLIERRGSDGYSLDGGTYIVRECVLWV